MNIPNDTSSQDRMPCNLVEARNFLRMIDAKATAFTFQSFDDNEIRKLRNTAPLVDDNRKPELDGQGKPRRGKDPLATVLNGTIEECWSQLVAMNEQGAGVFVTINKTNLTGRKSKDIIRIRAAFADLDGAPIEPVLHDTIVPRPHIIVETSPDRWHCYWLLDELDLAQFAPLQKALAARFNSDPSINDLPRVMRIPGFWHRKREPFLVRMRSNSSEALLDGKEFAKAFAAPLFDTTVRQPAIDQPAANASKSHERPANSGSQPNAFELYGEQSESSWRKLNDLAMQNLSVWVPVLFPQAAESNGGGYRVSSASLGRALQEDLSIAPTGIKDFGTHDIGDPRQGRRTPIDLVMEWKGVDKFKAFEWLTAALEGNVPAGGAADAAGAATAGTDDPTLELFWHGEPDDRPPASWLVERMIPATGIGLMSGQWGACKTFVAFDLAGSIATGLPFAGREIIRRGGTLFVAAEGGAEVRDRLKGVDHKLSGDAFAAAAAAGNPVEADLRHLPVVWAEEPIRFATPDGYKTLVAVAADAHQRLLDKFSVPLALIIFDTMGASVNFKDANATEENQLVMNMLRDISRATNAFVLVIDHFGKTVNAGTKNSMTKEDNADVVLAMLCDRDVGGNISNTRMQIRKLRRGKSGIEFPFDLKVVDIDDDQTTCCIKWKPERDDGAKGTSGKEKWTRAERIFRTSMEAAVLDKGKDLRPYGAEGPRVKAVPLSTVRSEFMAAYPADVEDQRERDAAKRSAFGRAMKSAREKNLVCSREIEGIDHLWLVFDEEVAYRKANGL